MNKYELTSEIINYSGHKLYRIKALKDFSFVKAGELGGWIESKRNLSQDGTAWVFDNAKVYGNSIVYENAEIHNTACIFDNAKVYGDAKVYNNVRIYNYAVVCGNTRVFNDVIIYNKAKVYGYINIYNKVQIYDEAIVCGCVSIIGNVLIHGNAIIDSSSIAIYGRVDICGNAKIYNRADYIVFKNFWSSGRYFTWTRSNNMWKVGCFYGTGEELIKKAYADSEKSGKEYERVVRYVESILADEQKDKQLK